MADLTVEVSVPLTDDGKYGAYTAPTDVPNTTVALHALKKRVDEKGLNKYVHCSYQYDAASEIIGLRVALLGEVPVLYSQKSPSTPEEKEGWRILGELTAVLDEDGKIGGVEVYVVTISFTPLLEVKKALSL